MLDVIAKYHEARDRVEELLKKSFLEMKGEFAEALRDLFAEFPNVESVSWHQYTPYFNDGDECVFSTSASYPRMIFVDDTEDDRDQYSYEEGYNSGENGELEQAREPAYQAFRQFLSQFPDELLKAAFGDHVKITVTREGVDVDSFDHD